MYYDCGETFILLWKKCKAESQGWLAIFKPLWLKMFLILTSRNRSKEHSELQKIVFKHWIQSFSTCCGSYQKMPSGHSTALPFYLQDPRKKGPWSVLRFFSVVGLQKWGGGSPFIKRSAHSDKKKVVLSQSQTIYSLKSKMCQLHFPGSDKFKVLCLGRSLIYLSPSKTVAQNGEGYQ